MRIFLLIAGFTFFSLQVTAQRNLIDSLQNVLSKEKTDTGKAHLLYQLSASYQIVRPDSALLLAEEAYVFSKRIKYLQGQSFSLNIIAGAFDRMGNNTQALRYYLEQLKIEETRHDPYNIAYVYMSIASLYNHDKDSDKAIFYAMKADSIIRSDTTLTVLSVYSKLNIGDMLEKDNQLDSALAYTMACYSEASTNGNMLVAGTALNNLGNIWWKKKDIAQAQQNYQAAMEILDSLEDNRNLTECMLGMARVYDAKGLTDSALYFARNSYMISVENNILDHASDASLLLTGLYKKQNNIDSAFAYQQRMINLNDSIRSSDKIKLLQSLTIEEQLRQKDLAEAQYREKVELKQKLQLLGIGIMIPVFFLFSMYISRKKVHKRVIEFSGILSILLLFEYITLLIHPYVAEKTHHSPILEIIIFVAIAAIITPSHHKIQSWVMDKLARIQEKYRHKPPPPPDDASEERGEPDVDPGKED